MSYEDLSLLHSDLPTANSTMRTDKSIDAASIKTDKTVGLRRLPDLWVRVNDDKWALSSTDANGSFLIHTPQSEFSVRGDTQSDLTFHGLPSIEQWSQLSQQVSDLATKAGDGNAMGPKLQMVARTLKTQSDYLLHDRGFKELLAGPHNPNETWTDAHVKMNKLIAESIKQQGIEKQIEPKGVDWLRHFVCSAVKYKLPADLTPEGWKYFLLIEEDPDPSQMIEAVEAEVPRN